MDDDEIFGAAIIGFATGTLTREFDRRGASNGSNRHDFDLLTSDGKSVVGALEVTAWRDGNILGLLEAMSADGNQWYDEPRLRHPWTVDISSVPGSYKRVRPRLTQWLATLEAHGVVDADTYHAADSGDAFAAKHEMCRAGAVGVSVNSDINHGHVAMVTRIVPGSHGADWKSSVEAIAWQDDNCTKLGRAAAHRHLLVLAYGPEFEPFAEHEGIEPPFDAPSLPPEVDTLWLADWLPHKSTRLWRYDRDSSCSGQELPDEFRRPAWAGRGAQPG